jgi:hypothetical protein
LYWNDTAQKDLARIKLQEYLSQPDSANTSFGALIEAFSKELPDVSATEALTELTTVDTGIVGHKRCFQELLVPRRPSKAQIVWFETTNPLMMRISCHYLWFC